MSEETQDIVQELHVWADIIDGAFLQGKANVVLLSGAVFVDAAAEITLLREERDDLQVLLRGRTAELQAENERLRATLRWFGHLEPSDSRDVLRHRPEGGPS